MNEQTQARALSPDRDNPRNIEALLPELIDAIHSGQLEAMRAEVLALHPADLGDVLEALSRDDRTAVVEVFGDQLPPELLIEVEGVVLEDVLHTLDDDVISKRLTELNSDDRIDMLEDLDEEAKQKILANLPEAARWAVEDALRYPESSTGRLMAREFVTVPADWNVGQTIDFLRANPDLPDDFYDIYLVDEAYRPVGSVSVSHVLRTRRAVPLTEVAQGDLRVFPPELDQEELAHTFRQYGVSSAPVADAETGRLVGVVTLDDIVHVIDEEAENDLMRLVGLGSVSDINRSSLQTARNRFIWLSVNLGTAVLASMVISLFQGTIREVVALAVLMPIVASMGGNAGTQTLAVAVRALAMKDLRARKAVQFITREALVGLFNGMGFALVAFVFSALWFQDVILGTVIAVAMLINLIVAGLSGTMVPIILDRLKIDPANASAVFLTTITDVVGFFVFLGLAAAFLV